MQSTTRVSSQAARDAGVIHAVLHPRARVCRECVAKKAALPRERIDEALSAAHRTDLVSYIGRCDACGAEGMVYTVA
jgi:hypothetical protein